MNIGELKELLSQFDDTTNILVAQDPEGNGFRPLTDIGWGFIEPAEDKHGYVESYLSPDEVDEEDEDQYEARVVFWP